MVREVYRPAQKERLKRKERFSISNASDYANLYIFLCVRGGGLRPLHEDTGILFRDDDTNTIFEFRSKVCTECNCKVEGNWVTKLTKIGAGWEDDKYFASKEWFWNWGGHTVLTETALTKYWLRSFHTAASSTFKVAGCRTFFNVS